MTRGVRSSLRHIKQRFLGSGDEEAEEIESSIWAKMREISGLNDEQIERLSDNEVDELYEKACTLLERD